jgi:hypothetical protein
MRKKESPRVFIAWVREGESGEHWFSTLAWNGGNGPTRTYVKDQYDARLDLGRDIAKYGSLPYFDNAGRAFLWMTSNWDSPCQINVGLAKLLKVDLES